jgi:hypothetical protein
MSFGLQQPFSVPFGHTYPSVVVPIDGLFNNQAASKNGAIADFDGQGSSFDARYLPNGSWVFDGIMVRAHTTHLLLSNVHLKFQVWPSVVLGSPSG